MSFQFKNISFWKLFAPLLFLIGLVVFLTLHFFWSNICVPLDCSTYTMGGYLAPLKYAGMIVAILTVPFLVLPTHYFRNWFLWIFLPLLAWSLYRVSLINPDSSNMFAQTRAEVVADMIYPWGFITILFIAWHWYRSRSQ